MSTPTPIALCITDLDPGGAEKGLVQIVTRLDRTQWAPEVYCLGPRGELTEVLDSAEIPTHCLNASPRDGFVVARLAAALRRQRPALLQTFLFHANIAGRLAGRVARVPVIVSGIRVAEREKRWHVAVERWTKGLVTQHVCVSRAVADFAKEQLRLRDDQVTVIPNGVDAEFFRAAEPADPGLLGIPASASVLLFVGRLHPQKGLFNLLAAMRELVAVDGRDVHLLIAGDGPQRAEAEAFVAQALMGDRVHFLGRRRDVASLMGVSTLLVLPSLWEGMPNVVLEAMAAGLPVVATKVDGTADLVTDRQTGWLCPPGDAAALVATLREVLDAPGERRRVAAEAQQMVVTEFTWESSAASYNDFWRRLLANRG